MVRGSGADCMKDTQRKIQIVEAVGNASQKKQKFVDLDAITSSSNSPQMSRDTSACLV